MSKYVLPRLELPVDTLLLYESLVFEDPDRTANFRFCFSGGGGFFHAANTQLWLTNPAQFNSDDPADHWNTPFPASPVRYLTDPQLTQLVDAIRQAGFASLSASYSSRQQQKPPTVERWTVVEGGRVKTVVVENHAAPSPLVKLRETINKLVAEAPRGAP